MPSSNQLTVGELISLLGGMSQDALVFTEGCDCYGEAGSVRISKDDGSVLIERPKQIRDSGFRQDADDVDEEEVIEDAVV